MSPNSMGQLGGEYVVFVAEDDADDWGFLEEAFAQVGCVKKLEHFLSSAQLLEHLHTLAPEALPDLIVLDHQTPGLNGSEMVGRLRSLKAYDNITVVVFSTSFTPSMKQGLLAQGVAYCMVKPDDWSKYASLIALFCEAVRQKKAGA